MADGSHLWQALSDTIQRAVNLRIITLVGDAQVQGALESLKVSAPSATSRSLITDINLVAGDITTVASEQLLGPEHSEVRAMHQAAVTQAQQIVARNAEILVSIAKQIGEQLHLLPPPSSTPTSGNQP